MHVPGLRSPYESINGLAIFPRVVDKIRLEAAGQLPDEYRPFLGSNNRQTLDARVTRFLQVSYDDLARQTLAGGSDESLLEWAYATGYRPDEWEVEIFSTFMLKRGWRDNVTGRLRETLAEAGMNPKVILTFPDRIDADEGRPLRYPPDPELFAGEVKPSTQIEGLPSPYEMTGGVVHFPRMAAKARLAQAGRLPADWDQSRGKPTGFDGMLCRFLGIDYPAFDAEARRGASDEDLFSWAEANGGNPSDERREIFSGFLSKRGWRDTHHHRLEMRLREAGMPSNAALTMFDFIDLDEGRPRRIYP